ncbi:MAG: hypothetical protein IPN91_14105 [Holophagaceae bacterium]|uniref:Uncharacterized protein n=1 Tax=Candidatus Geothrix odensensis TaxID=2954440 RepID=A0A936F4L0_9BACT|nr:hypothetical protein [Candidatus Geothrix odensensis]
MTLPRFCIRLSLVCALPLCGADAEDKGKPKSPPPRLEPSAVVEVTAPCPRSPWSP